MGKIDDLFSNQIDIYQALIDKDIEKLKLYGTVGQSIKEVDGIKTITYTFTSAEGSVYIFSDSSFTDNILYKKIQKLNKEIADAVSTEDYRLAAKLKTEKDQLLIKNN
jgi:hypothetical protein